MKPASAAVAKGATTARLLRSLLDIGLHLSATRDRRQMLEMVVSEARRLTRAEAGSLYVARNERLEFVVAQNDRVDLSRLKGALVGQSVHVGGSSLAGFVAATGRAMNIPNSYRLPPGTPFRINRDFDAATGYRTRSILALPLRCPDGEGTPTATDRGCGPQIVGVLQLINRLAPSGRLCAFAEHEGSPLLALASMAAVSIQNMLLSERLRQAHLDSILRLAVVAEFRDQGTANHLRRISHVSSAIAKAMRLPNEQVELIEAASPMHDIGKIGIPDSILLKPAALTPEERAIVETHTLLGAQILRNPGNELLAMAQDVALHHHERWDGHGYPDKLRGRRISLAARIVCLADVFDALATRRCYKPPVPIPQVVEIIRAERGRQFDADPCDALLGVLDELTVMYADQH